LSLNHQYLTWRLVTDGVAKPLFLMSLKILLYAMKLRLVAVPLLANR